MPRDIEPDARSLGTSLHLSLGQYYRNQIPGEKYIDPWEIWAAQSSKVLEEDFDLGSGMLNGYYKRAPEMDEGWKPLAIEKRVTTRVPGTNVVLAGTWDMLVEIGAPANRRLWGLWICDWKGYKVLLSPDQLEFNDQVTSYIWLAHRNNIPVKGLIFSQLRKSVPRAPEALANGKGISRNKSIITDKETYLQAVVDAGFDPEDYMDFVNNDLKQVEFFRRDYVMRSPRTIEQYAEELRRELRDMTTKHSPIYPNFSDNPMVGCQLCDYRILCRTASDGGDTDQVKRDLYVVEAGSVPERRES